MLTIDECDTFPAGHDLDISLASWLGLYCWWGLVRLRPSRRIHDALVAAATRSIPTSGATRFCEGLTLHVEFNQPRDLAAAWFIDNETGNVLSRATADVPELAISRSLLKLKYGHF